MVREAENLIWTMFFGMTTIASLIWVKVEDIGIRALLYYMKHKGYDLPEKKEIRKFTRYAAREALGLSVDEID